jgi:tRNA-dihydrouridine synthase B
MMKLSAKISNFKPKNRIFLAPMAEVNDLAFRELCKQAGCGLAYTGMINPLIQKDLKKELKDIPAIQLFCKNEKGIKEFIKKYEPQASLFDFNLGCPAKNARKEGFGCFMHNKLGDIERILKTMRENTKKPITIKLRKSKSSLKIIKIAEKYCDAICIHPRTQEQGYGGEPDLKFALQIKKRTKLPIIYSGNVNENNYQELLKKFDFIMIGRASLGNPSIFSKLTGKKQKAITFRDYLELAEKYNLPFRQIKQQAMYFTKGKENACELRAKIAKAKAIDQLIYCT